MGAEKMFKRKSYVYHLVYTFTGGNGSMTLYQNKKITDPQDIRDIKKYIEEEHGHRDVVLTNWIKLKKMHVPEA